MSLASAPARWLGCLAFCFLHLAGAQPLPSGPEPEAQTLEELIGRLPGEQLLPPEQLPAEPLRLERAWEVVELLGQPMLTDAPRPARVLIRPEGSLWVDGGCNYFSGRTERDAQGRFRVSQYGGTHGHCNQPPRSEAFLNSALVMVDNYRWDRGLVLRSGDRDLIRLLPSVNQDSQDIEQALAGRAAPAALPAAAAAALAAPAAQAVQRNCRQVKTQVRKGGKLTTVSRLVCKPAKPATAKARAGKSKATAKARSDKPAASQRR
jgi:hypothetical protein